MSNLIVGAMHVLQPVGSRVFAQDVSVLSQDGSTVTTAPAGVEYHYWYPKSFDDIVPAGVYNTLVHNASPSIEAQVQKATRMLATGIDQEWYESSGWYNTFNTVTTEGGFSTNLTAMRSAFLSEVGLPTTSTVSVPISIYAFNVSSSFMEATWDSQVIAWLKEDGAEPNGVFNGHLNYPDFPDSSGYPVLSGTITNSGWAVNYQAVWDMSLGMLNWQTTTTDTSDCLKNYGVQTFNGTAINAHNLVPSGTNVLTANTLFTTPFGGTGESAVFFLLPTSSAPKNASFAAMSDYYTFTVRVKEPLSKCVIYLGSYTTPVAVGDSVVVVERDGNSTYIAVATISSLSPLALSAYDRHLIFTSSIFKAVHLTYQYTGGSQYSVTSTLGTHVTLAGIPFNGWEGLYQQLTCYSFNQQSATAVSLGQLYFYR